MAHCQPRVRDVVLCRRRRRRRLRRLRLWRSRHPLSNHRQAVQRRRGGRRGAVGASLGRGHQVCDLRARGVELALQRLARRRRLRRGRRLLLQPARLELPPRPLSLVTQADQLLPQRPLLPLLGLHPLDQLADVRLARTYSQLEV